MISKRTNKSIAIAISLLFASFGASSATTDLASSPLVTSTSSSVRPNIMFVLDDSGSMGWDFLPDWACAPVSATNSACSSTGEDPNSARNEYWFRSAAYNGVAYNPSVTYKAPAYFNTGGTANTTTYVSQTAANTSNWTQVKNNPYVSSGTSNLIGQAYFYTIVPGEYCNAATMKSCNTQTAPSGSYTFPASVRWCNSSGLTTCQASFNSATGSNFTYARAPAPRTATITIGGSGGTTVSNIKINGVEILSATTSSSTTTSTVASNIANGINACSFGLSGNCGTVGYRATSSGSVVTISAPGAITYTPVITKSAGMSATSTAFAQGSIPGDNLLTVITSTVTSYASPGTATKASTRSDCAGTTCTYDEEMTNFANWWAYYRTRMQTMKSAASLAFAPVGSGYRIGYLSINNNTNSDFLNIDQFTGATKRNWYDKFFAATPGNSTPLRVALAKAGRFYAGKLDGTTLNGSTVVDPIQYSCQQNFTILSTDGYWNESSTPKQIDGTTDIGSQDFAEPSPMNDGGHNIVTTVTPTTTVVRNQTVTSNQTTKVWNRDQYSIGALGANGCSSTKRRVLSQNQQQTETLNTTTTAVTDVTTTSTQTIVTDNGVQTTNSPTSTTNTTTVSSNTVTNSDTFSSWANNGSLSNVPGCSTNPSLPNPNPSATTLFSTATSTTAVPAVTVLSTTGPTVGSTTTTSAATGGTSNTLADVADYYYKTDLRTPALSNCTGVPVSPATTGNTLCSTPTPPLTTEDPYNDVFKSGLDAASWQHMTTFTLGLGANGYMQYSSNYAGANSGDFFDIKNGTTANPSGGICSWQSSGSCTWPVPVSNTQTTIDDLWHAAVNGRGTYFNAGDPTSLTAGLSSALGGVGARSGAAAAATTSTPNVTTTDNFVFSSIFRTSDWTGEIFRQQIDVSTGIPFNTIDWTAQAPLDAKVYSTRNIYTFTTNTGTWANKLKPLVWANLTGTEQAYFNQPAINTLSQFCVVGTTCLTTANQALAAGTTLLDFIRGDRTNEEGAIPSVLKYYRLRQHVLGDIVNSEAAYIAAPRFSYGDWGYSAFVAANQSRRTMVYVGANDGMLHAFYGADCSTCSPAIVGGAEAWTYIPSMLLPKLYKLADKNYPNLHEFYVDGTPTTGDVCISNCATPGGGATTPVAVWKTILVGGLNAGGRGFYALDVTDPASPKALWEFTDANMGYSYGNPKIAKLQDGTWVVLLTSGYNNVSPGDGQGRLYVLNAYTGALINTINTGVGSDIATVTGCSAAPCPSGLSKIAARVVNPSTDNTILAVYGGDLYGNLWRFDVNNNIGAAGYDAQLLATLRGPSPGSKPQPITAKPDVGIVNGNVIVLVGTGSYLGAADVGDSSVQSFYAIKDIPVPDLLGTGTSGSPSYSNPRTFGNFIQQTFTVTTCPPNTDASICTTGEIVRTGTNNVVNFGSNNGWYVDLPSSGERVNADPILTLGTVLFNTNIPGATACTVGGTSFQYFLNYRTGGPVSTASTGVVGVKLANSLATRPVIIQLPNGVVVALTVTSAASAGSGSSSGGGGGGGGTEDLGNNIVTTNPPIGSGGGATRRVSWRELTTDQ